MKKKAAEQPKQTKKQDDLQVKVDELTLDLQRVRADFENYRKRMDAEKQTAQKNGETRAVLQLLPVIDTVERAILHIPGDIADHPWVKGVGGLIKQLDTSLAALHLKRIAAHKGADFDPELHQAVQFDENAEGDKEVIAEELQAGYTLNGTPIRHSMVKVTRK